jgi:D-alanine--poly(phosphoribitol) ligase subunit 1
MTHANVLNLIEWGKEAFAISHEDISTNVNPLYFDNSVFDFYSSIFNGACLVPFSKQETRNPKTLVEKIDAAGCTLWFSVPSLLIFLQTMKAADGRYLRSIKRFIFGGEGYPKPKLQALFNVYSGTSEFFNVSGPTECTCICSLYKITADDFHDLQGFPPLGSIADNFSYLILGDDNKKVQDGALGELCLLGPNVGLGYYNDPGRTDVSFVQNPYNTEFEKSCTKPVTWCVLKQLTGNSIFRAEKIIRSSTWAIALSWKRSKMPCIELNIFQRRSQFISACEGTSVSLRFWPFDGRRAMIKCDRNCGSLSRII